ncbi:MAG: DNA repair protein RecN [Pseudomonadota bacterium]
MLQLMHIRNFAIIDEVSVEFGAGMNVLTGETGAGKSILIDALGLVLGQRATTSVIRTGAERTDISAEFSLSGNDAARDWLAEQSLDEEQTCHVRRVISRDGRSRGFINGTPVPMQSLRTLGEHLVGIHGQHEHQTLQNGQTQRDLLDARGGLSTQRANVAARFDQWREADSALQALRDAQGQREDRLEFLSFQLRELEALDLSEDEVSSLEPERLRLANSGRLAQGSIAALDALYDDDAANAQSLLATAIREVTALDEYDHAAMAPVSALLTEAEVNIAEAAEQLRRYNAGLEADPARQEFLESRLATIEGLARKHRVEANALPAHIDTLRAERDALANADEQLDALSHREQAARNALGKAARTLSKARTKAARAFADEVTNGMQTLGMPGGVFEVNVTELAEAVPARHGNDKIAFTVSANPGQALQALASVASGGELSRISLAIQVAAGRKDQLPSMIFDEVDSGVGGGVAEIVGQQMRALADSCQVLAVTHLPQVASQAHHHHKVSKMTDGKSTRTTITTLSADARVEEIARMLGGVDITDLSRKHAREMLVDEQKTG